LVLGGRRDIAGPAFHGRYTLKRTPFFIAEVLLVAFLSIFAWAITCTITGKLFTSPPDLPSDLLSGSSTSASTAGLKI
jgi:hypothetical protein